MQRMINVYKLGRLDYKKCLSIQKFLVQQQLEPNKNSSFGSDSMLLVEHEPVYTVGIRRNSYKENDLNELRALNAQVEYTDRGGLITFHGPGQLVAYPILNLKHFQPSLKWYVSRLEQVIIDLCKEHYDLKAYRLCNIGYTGVWTNDAKIAAIGVHCKRYITYHGLSLNCDVDLKWFTHIVPCGIADKKVSSLSEQMGKRVVIDSVIPLFKSAFERQFNSQLVLKSEQETFELVNSI